jgi:hypothetical protein
MLVKLTPGQLLKRTMLYVARCSVANRAQQGRILWDKGLDGINLL